MSTMPGVYKGIDNYWHGVVIPKVKLKTMQLPKCFSSTICHHLRCLRTLCKRLRHHFTLTSLQRLIQLEDLTLQEVNNAKERN